jgi:hypothetical protein
VRDIEKESRYRLLDAARTYLILLGQGQAKIAGVLDELARQAHGNADRLRAAAEQLRRRFPGAEPVALLESAAEHADNLTTLEPPVFDQSPGHAAAP